VTDSERPVDLLVASLLATKPTDGEAKETKAEEGVPDEKASTVQRTVDVTARPAVPLQTPRATRVPLLGPRRLDGLSGALARFFDFGEEAARGLLARIDTQEEWMEGPDAGISVLPVEAGPAASTALASLVRLPPGVTLSEHGHVGREQLLVLEGGFADSAGHVVWPGETLQMAAGTSHSMWGLPGPACICAALLFMDGGDGGG
jgi:putative transcriptional regulator